ncbi:IS5 family transposase [Edwardsiella ictaluri]|nr:IS5 family transposase [Edwardsiella ictaluri]UCQ49402.1 IS5 family transposase [Edwardsiella ictaluri]UCQ52654.1 IS5 family transposase [Edwardsiella ictaluri]WFO11324.1 IS5 family transposase [Edwardsiella ictaluri]WFO14219.1 IS5 family transposase [Edwardsiella ictaluri]
MPPQLPSSRGGRPGLDDDAVLNGILFVLTTGIPWEELPQSLGFGSAMTCWRRLRDWQVQGIWLRLHVALLTRLHQAAHIDWSRASLDGASVASPRKGQETGRNPTDRGKLGSKRHIVVQRQGIPRAVLVSGANRHDPIMFEPLLDALPALAGPRYRPDKRHADKGYDFRRCRDYLRRRGIKARIARRGMDSHDRLGRYRWVVERTHGWLAGFGKLRIRFERRLDTHLALLTLACAVICLRFVERFC